MKSLPFHIPEALKKVPFRAEPSRIGHYKDSPLSPRETEFHVQSNSPHVWLILVCIFPQIEEICDTQYVILKPLYSFLVQVRAVGVKRWLISMSQVTRRIKGNLPFKVVIIKIDCSNRVTIDLPSFKT